LPKIACRISRNSQMKPSPISSASTVGPVEQRLARVGSDVERRDNVRHLQRIVERRYVLDEARMHHCRGIGELCDHAGDARRGEDVALRAGLNSISRPFRAGGRRAARACPFVASMMRCHGLLTYERLLRQRSRR
jgi:hypothetical protein